jgi:hypothetical protein
VGTQGGSRLKASHNQPKTIFSVFEAFSFLLNNGNWLRGSPINDETLHPHKTTRTKTMTKENPILQKIHEETDKFQKTMEELRLLRNVAADLRNYRKMIKLKKWD